MAEKGNFQNFAEFIDGFSSNLAGPIPIVVGQTERLLSEAFNFIDPEDRFRSLKLLTYSFTGIRSAILLANGGATTAVPPVLRTSLEAAAYGYLFHTSKDWADTWRRREDDPKARKKFREEGPAAVRNALRQIDNGLFKEYRNLYDMLIDFGAHPNVFGVEAVIKYEPLAEDRVYVSFHQLTGSDERTVAQCITVQVAMFLLTVMSKIWPQEFESLKFREFGKQLMNDLEKFREANVGQ